MIRKNQKWLNLINGALDFIILYAAYFAARYVRFTLLPGVDSVGDLLQEQLLAALFGLVMLVAYGAAGIYGRSRFGRFGEELLRLVLVNALGVVGFAALLYLIRVEDFSRGMLGIFFCLATLTQILKRMALRRFLQYYRSRGYNQKHVLLVGGGHEAEEYYATMAHQPQLGVIIDGYVSDVPNPALGKRMGAYGDLLEIMERGEFDEVVVALAPQEYALMPKVLADCEKEGLRICILPFFNDYLPNRPTIEVVGQCKLIHIRDIPLDKPFYAALKRAMDLVGSLLLILLTSPLMLVEAIGVKLSSPGPILFRQERVGKNKKPFVMYKFRSMRVNAAQDSAWSRDVDPRKTKFGSFLRKTSLDELPQFFNVLKGDMSLIGPRPEIPFHVEHFKEDIPLYMVRHQVRPGITGWAQVNGLRGDTSIEERVKFDIWYIENWSPALDISILFRTVFGGMVNQEKL